MIGPLLVTPDGPSDDAARLDAFVWSGARADLAVWVDARGERTIARSRVEIERGARIRLRVRSTVDDEAPCELDRSTFLLGEDAFVERGRDGVDLVLPATLRRGEPVRPVAADPRTVTMVFAGPALLSLAGAAIRRRALLLRLQDPAGPGVDQWLAEGVGEVCLGPAGGHPDRWVIAWRGGDRREALFGGG